jgi:poly-beta-1,6-N-acetyl-D-glucosamine synthase
MNYIMITPVKNEQQFIYQTIDSVVSQNVLPLLWIIVDGGSNDDTREIIQSYSTRFPWIVLLNQHVFGKTSHMSVSLAMEEAYVYALMSGVEFEYIWTIDGDQVLDPMTCHGIITSMSEDLRVGAASGGVFNGEKQDIFPHGELPNKRVYRKSALHDVGGFPITKYSFDTVILAKLRMEGWEIKTFPEYKIHNLREDSGIERNYFKSSVQFGKARWYLGYSFPLLVMGCGYLFIHGKYLKAFGVFYGWVRSFAGNDDIIKDIGIWNHFHNDRLKEVLRK